MPSKQPLLDKPLPDEPASQLPLDLGELTRVEPAGKPKKSKQPPDPALTAPGREERVSSREEFVAAIKTLGGDAICIQRATGALYRIVFGMTTAQLYKHHGAPKNERDFLPIVVQHLIQLHELINAEKVRNHTLPTGMEAQAEINEHILVVVQKQTRQTEIYLSTHKLFGKGTLVAQKKASSPITIESEYGPLDIPVLELENESDIPF